MKIGQFLLCTKDLYMVGTTENPVFCKDIEYLIVEVEIEDSKIILLDETNENHTVTDDVLGWLKYFKTIES